MVPAQDSMNCLKNLLQIMCCDGSIDREEKKFLSFAAKQLNIEVNDWNAFLQDVLKDGVPMYPVYDRDKAIATLKALVTMAKADTYVDDAEKKYVQDFAKSIGVTKDQWKQILADIQVEEIFKPFQQRSGSLVVLKEDFDQIDAFLTVARENGAVARVAELKPWVESGHQTDEVVCFHASPDKDTSLTRCQMLLDKTGGNAVSVLTRFQGHLVKYMLEIGLQKCIIEPVYPRDIIEIFRTE